MSDRGADRLIAEDPLKNRREVARNTLQFALLQNP